MKSLKPFVCGIALLLFSSRLLALDYSNSELGFKATLPDGLQDASKMMRVKSLVSLGKWNESKTSLLNVVSIQDLGGAIGREDLSKRNTLPANATIEKIPWKSFQIDLFRILEGKNGVSVITFNAQVPLKPHAIQISVVGPAEQEAELRKQIQDIVASVDGPSNWLTKDERIDRVAYGIGRLVGAACVLLVIIVLAVRKMSR